MPDVTEPASKNSKPQLSASEIKKTARLMRKIGLGASRNAIRQHLELGVPIAYMKDGEIVTCMPTKEMLE